MWLSALGGFINTVFAQIFAGLLGKLLSTDGILNLWWFLPQPSAAFYIFHSEPFLFIPFASLMRCTPQSGKIHVSGQLRTQTLIFLELTGFENWVWGLRKKTTAQSTKNLPILQAMKTFPSQCDVQKSEWLQSTESVLNLNLLISSTCTFLETWKNLAFYQISLFHKLL